MFKLGHSVLAPTMLYYLCVCTQSVRSNKERSLGDPQWINKLVTFFFFGPPWGQQVEANITIFFFLLTWIFKKEEATSCEWRAAYHSTLMIKTPALISPSTAWFLCVSISATSEVKRFFCKYFFFFFTFEGVNVAETCHFFFFFDTWKNEDLPLNWPLKEWQVLYFECVCVFSSNYPIIVCLGPWKAQVTGRLFDTSLSSLESSLFIHSLTNKKCLISNKKKKSPKK